MWCLPRELRKMPVGHPHYWGYRWDAAEMQDFSRARAAYIEMSKIV